MMNILNTIKKSYAFPALMRIDMVRIEKTVGGYNADGEVVTPHSSGGFKNTGEKLTRVPVCILSASRSGAGLYGRADADDIAVVQFIDGNRAYPIVTGYYTDEYVPAVDDGAAISVHAGAGQIRIASTTASLYNVLDNIIAALLQLKTQGGPANQVISPDTISLLQIEKQKLAQVLKE